MTTITLEEAQANLAGLIAELKPGEEILITAEDRPVARLVAEPPNAREPRRPGSAIGKLTIVEDDDARWDRLCPDAAAAQEHSGLVQSRRPRRIDQEPGAAAHLHERQYPLQGDDRRGEGAGQGERVGVTASDPCVVLGSPDEHLDVGQLRRPSLQEPRLASGCLEQVEVHVRSHDRQRDAR